MSHEERDEDLQRILQIAVESERLVGSTFNEDKLELVVAGLFLHAITYARVIWKKSTVEQKALVEHLNTVAETCEDQTDPIALAIVQGDPVQLLRVMCAVALSDQRVDEIVHRTTKREKAE